MAFTNRKVTIYYWLYGGLYGDTESFYLNTVPPAGLFGPGSIVDQYLQARLAMSTPDLQAVYARATVPGSPRNVDWSDLTAANYFGKYGAQTCEPKICMLLRGQTNIGAGMKQFIRAIPETQIKGRVIFINGTTWINAVNSYCNFITTNTYIVWKQSFTHSVADRKYLSTIAALPHRGFAATCSNPLDIPALGDELSFGGEGSQIFGANGRKIVTSVLGAGVFDVGGARPVIGTPPAPGQMYFYNLSPAAAAATTLAPRSLTERNIGGPFVRPHGRKPNLLSLRQ